MQLRLIVPEVTVTLKIPFTGVVLAVPAGVKPALNAQPETVVVPAPVPGVPVLMPIAALTTPAKPAGNEIAPGAGV